MMRRLRLLASASAVLAVAALVSCAECPADVAKTAHSPTHGDYCVCVQGTECQGPECKRGSHGGTVVHGYPLACVACACKLPGAGVAHVTVTDAPAVRITQTPAPPPVLTVKHVEPTAAPDKPARPTISHGGLTLLLPTLPPPKTKKHPDGDDTKIKVIYIKSYKVGSTTVAAIFQRLAEEKDLKTASRYNAVGRSNDDAFDLIYGHNYYANGNSGGNNPCIVRFRPENGWTWCGGYQPWMDEYVVNATRLVMIAEPVSRMASMYYYEKGYTKLKDRLPGDTEYGRLANDPDRYEDPTGKDKKFIEKWLFEDFDLKWDRVQWYWLREATNNRTLQESIQLLKERFFVGLTKRFDESLLMWKRALQLETRDMLYTAVKAQLSHPKVGDWAEEHQSKVASILEQTGDDKYYEAALAKFEAQVQEYGPSQLSNDHARFQKLLARLHEKCKDTFVITENLHVPDQVFCMLKAYDKEYFANEATKPVSYLGCFSDPTPETGFSDRYSQKLLSRDMTLATCTNRCRKDRLEYFAVGFGTSCYCGPKLPQAKNKIDDSLCSAPCGGDGTQICGGMKSNAVSVYSINPRGPDWTDPII